MSLHRSTASRALADKTGPGRGSDIRYHLHRHFLLACGHRGATASATDKRPGCPGNPCLYLGNHWTAQGSDAVPHQYPCQCRGHPQGDQLHARRHSALFFAALPCL
jgi:hypothetical protein